MCVRQFEQNLALLNLKENEREWFPKWLRAYASFAPVRQRIGADEMIVVEKDLVIGRQRGDSESG